MRAGLTFAGELPMGKGWIPSGYLEPQFWVAL